MLSLLYICYASVTPLLYTVPYGTLGPYLLHSAHYLLYTDIITHINVFNLRGELYIPPVNQYWGCDLRVSKSFRAVLEGVGLDHKIIYNLTRLTPPLNNNQEELLEREIPRDAFLQLEDLVPFFYGDEQDMLDQEV
jgi:hypothetical protein